MTDHEKLIQRKELIQRILKDGRRDQWANLIFYPNREGLTSWEEHQGELAQMLNYARQTLKKEMVPSNWYSETGLDFERSEDDCSYTVQEPHAHDHLGFDFWFISQDQEIGVAVNAIGCWEEPTCEEREAIKKVAEYDTHSIAFHGADAFAYFVDSLVEHCGFNIPPGIINPYDPYEEDYAAWVQEDNPENGTDNFIANPQGDAP
jgi:hypothetical protein